MAIRRTTIRALAATGSGLLAWLGLALATAAYADVRRCEDSNGRVTYSNESCPSGTAKERAVEQRPAVEVPREGTAGKATHDGVLKRPAVSEVRDHAPERSVEVSREQSKALVARCDDLVRRIEYSQQDLQTATGAERASVELGLRRLQEEHETNCARH